jgi:bacterioferritin-associated ferredoxin
MPKIIVCQCEDVTLDDLNSAFEAGQRDMESLKRYTGLATGFCQGKVCLAAAGRFLARLQGGDAAVPEPTRTRPPLHPTKVACLAALADKNEEPRP